MRRSILSVTFLVVGSFSLAACGSKSDVRESATDGANTPASDSASQGRDLALSAEAIKHGGVQWTSAAERAIAGAIEVPGELTANEDRTARLGAPAQGRVVAVHVQVGDHVATNQALVTLQSSEASGAQADYNKGLADLNARRAAATYARTSRERAERLLAAKAVPRQDVERALADDELAKAEVVRAEAEVARTQTLLRHLGVGPEGTMVARSPIAGVVLSRDAVPGAVVQAGMPLATVSDPSTLWLDIAVTDRIGSLLRSGTHVRFTVPAFPGDTFAARVLSVGSALNATTRTVPVRAIVENTRARLRTQMFATVWLDVGDVKQAVTVPESAMMLLDEKQVVFVAHPGEAGAARFERRNIVVGGRSGGMVQILSGIVPGDLVVTQGAFAIKAEFSRSKLKGG